MKYLLMNIAREHEGHPACMPSRELRDGLKTGEYAKLVFISDEAKTEAMWVKVVSELEDGKYVGTLENDPDFIYGLKCGDAVVFKPKHINSIGKHTPFEGGVQREDMTPDSPQGLLQVLKGMFGDRVSMVMVGPEGEEPVPAEIPGDKSKLH